VSLSPADVPLLIAAAFGAGVANAIAGGGTLLTFPALLFAGLPGITANATSAVALVPGALASAYGYRRELGAHRRWLSVLAPPSLLGGLAGGMLLLATPERTFTRLAPWLVLFATLLFVVQGWLAGDRAGRVAPLAVGACAQVLVAVYGGYFGAGMGILMLAILGFLGLEDIHGMNGLKSLCGVCINGVAAAWFLARGAVDGPAVLVMALGAAAGGWAGAGLARRIGRAHARHAVVTIGFLVTVALLLRRD